MESIYISTVVGRMDAMMAKYPLLIISSIGIYISLFFWLHQTTFLTPYDHQNYQQRYQDSQFGTKTSVIADEDLYAFAGYHYLTSGDLSQVNVEHPPLGKYFIGLSILLFKNQTLLNLFWGGMLLVLCGGIAQEFFRSLFPAMKASHRCYYVFFTCIVIMTEPIFWHNLTHSLLDLPQTTFSLAFLWITLKRPILSPTQPWILGVILGLLAATKFPAMALILFCSWGLVTIWNQHTVSKSLIFSLRRIGLVGLVGAGVFTMTYLPLLYTKGLFVWLETLLMAIKIHLSHVPDYPPGAILQVLFFNQWPRWWGAGGVQPAPTWNWTWPFWGAGFLLSPLLLHRWVKQKKYSEGQFTLFFLFPWLYFLFLASRLFFPNYFLVLLPFSVIFLLAFVHFFATKKPPYQ